MEQLPETIVEQVATFGVQQNFDLDSPYAPAFIGGGIAGVIALAFETKGYMCPSEMSAAFSTGGAIGVGTDIAVDAAVEQAKLLSQAISSSLSGLLNTPPPSYVPTNNWGEPGGCGSGDCLLYMKSGR